MFRFPFGSMHELNLDWFLQEWEIYKQEWADAQAAIDNALQGEIDRVEDAMTDLYAARDAAVQAKEDAETAAGSALSDATQAGNDALKSEGYALGEQDGTPVGAGSPYYQQNAKYYKVEAGTYRYLSEAYAKGEMGGSPVAPGEAGYQDNAKYYKGLADADAAATAADRVQTGLDAAATAADRVQTGLDKTATGNDRTAVALDKSDTDLLKAAANAAALRSEGFAAGTQNGTPVGSDSPYYENNAAWYYGNTANIDGENAQKMISASEEASSTAAYDHASGSYFRMAGKLYQATADIEIGDTITAGTNCVEKTVGEELASQSEKIDENATNIGFVNIPLSWLDNIYINPNTGAYASASTCQATDFIGVIPKTLLRIYACMPGQVNVGYAFYNENYQYISGGAGDYNVTHAMQEEIVVVPDGAYFIRIANYKVYYPSTNAYLHLYMVNNLLYSWYDDSSNLSIAESKTHTTPITTTDTENRFILDTGVQGNLNGYTLKEFLSEINAIYYIYTEIEPARSSAVPLVLCGTTPYYYNQKDKWISVVVGNGEKCYVNSLTSVNVVIEKYVFNSYQKKQPNVFRMYQNIVCCGDSLTYSMVYPDANPAHARQSLVPYPKALEKLSGTETSILAASGYDCQQWWDAYNSQISGANKLYLIYLGTNETDENLTNTAATDCAGDDLTQYATNGTGYYGRIIRKILDTGSKCVLIKIALGATGNNRNQAIAGLASRFGVPVIDNPQYMLVDMNYHYGDTTDYYNTIHLNDLGYEYFAELIADRINKLSASEKYFLMPRTAT